MSEDSQALPSGEKQYWHDRRLDASRTVGPSTGQMADQPHRQGNLTAVHPVVTPVPLRTIPNLRHPIAAFVLVILAVILVGVGVLAASGQAALPSLPVPVADCPRPSAVLLGAPGAQFTAALPSGTQGFAFLHFCQYFFRSASGTTLTIESDLGRANFGGVAAWTGSSGVTLVTVRHAQGSEAFHCDLELNQCRGMLSVSLGHAKWQVLGLGNAQSLPTIKAFLRSFRPAR